MLSLKTKNYQLKTNKGFTLIEVLLVVAIITILAAASAPFYSRFLLQNATKNASDQLAGMLREAETYALSGKDGSDWSVNYDSVTNKLTLNRATPSKVFLSYTLNHKIQVSGSFPVVFSHPAGTPSTTGAFSVTSGNNTKTVDLNNQGMIYAH